MFVTLYHHTQQPAYRAIAATGVLLPNSKGDPPRGHHAPNVVWLSAMPVLGFRHKTEPISHRIVLRLPRELVEPWPDWATRHGFPAGYVGMCTQVSNHSVYWVSERAIPACYWVTVQELTESALTCGKGGG